MTDLIGMANVVKGICQAYPDALANLTTLRARAVAEGVTWPAWCWTPMAASAAYVLSRHGSSADFAPVHAISLWRRDGAVLQVSEDAQPAPGSR